MVRIWDHETEERIQPHHYALLGRLFRNPTKPLSSPERHWVARLSGEAWWERRSGILHLVKSLLQPDGSSAYIFQLL